MTVRIGIVGAGKMGLSHLAIANAHPEASVTAVCDTSRYVLGVLEKYANVKTFRDHGEMLADGSVDAIIVATPSSTHFQCAKEAMQKGIHVFVEKPLTLSPAESRALSELAISRKLVNQVGFHNRFIGTFQETRRLVKAGALGKITGVRGSAFGQVVIKEQGSTWRTKKSEGGGCLHDYACHVIDLMNFVMGPPARVAGARLQQIYSRDVEDAVYALFDYGDGASGVLETNWSDETYRKMSTVLEVQGTHGKLLVDRQELKVYLRDGCAFERYPEGWSIRYITELQAPVSYYLRGEEYSAQMDAFVGAIARKADDNENSFASAFEADRVLDLIVQASQARN